MLLALSDGFAQGSEAAQLCSFVSEDFPEEIAGCQEKDRVHGRGGHADPQVLGRETVAQRRRRQPSLAAGLQGAFFQHVSIVFWWSVLVDMQSTAKTRLPITMSTFFWRFLIVDLR